MLVLLGSLKGSSCAMVRSSSLSAAVSMESLDVSGSPWRSSTSMSLSASCSLTPAAFSSFFQHLFWLLGSCFVVGFGSLCCFFALLLSQNQRHIVLTPSLIMRFYSVIKSVMVAIQ